MRPIMMMRVARMAAIALAGIAGALCDAAAAPAGQAVEVWLTTADGAERLAEQAPLTFEKSDGRDATIAVDSRRRMQRMVGFGGAVTDATADIIANRLDPEQRRRVLAELFGPAPGLGFSFTRVTLGASDFSKTHYSYDDQPRGETDPSLAAFSIEPARPDLIPVLREALAVNPDLKIMATPWSPPGWMKSSKSMIGGTLRDDMGEALAEYLVRAVGAFGAAGVPIDYISIQNEPDFAPGNYPGMRLTPAQRARLIGQYVGPAFRRARTPVKILEWDHNWDKPEQPLTVLADKDARREIAGVAWHCYDGDVDAQSKVRDRFPSKDVFFTECAGGGWKPAWPDGWAFALGKVTLGATRNWARGVLYWNLALDEAHGPHLGGCGNCRGVITIDRRTGEIERSPEYYALGHLSRFVRPGARRIGSETKSGKIDTVAFLNRDGSRVLLAYNPGAKAAEFTVGEGRRGVFSYSLPAGAAATFVWNAALHPNAR